MIVENTMETFDEALLDDFLAMDDEGMEEEEDEGGEDEDE
jgi:hypothetical protein